MEDNRRMFNKNAWKAVGGALVLVLVGQGILAWQYHRIEKERLPKIEQQIQQQKEESEQRLAQNALEKFLDARIANDETKAMRYMTEISVRQKETGAFTFFGNFASYKVNSWAKEGDGSFRFIVDLLSPSGRVEEPEVIDVTEYSGEYYVDSVKLAG